MVEYDLYLPLHHNDGRPIPEEKLDRMKKLLVERFGGLTHFPQENEGLWKMGGKVFRDRIVIYRVLAEEAGAARAFFERLRDQLKTDLGQADVLIVEREVRTLDD
jgi:hypothetical protein